MGSEVAICNLFDGTFIGPHPLQPSNNKSRLQLHFAEKAFLQFAPKLMTEVTDSDRATNKVVTDIY